MSKTKHQLNRRKQALSILKRKWEKKGYEFKKAVSNTITFRNPDTNDKQRVTLCY